MIIPIIASITRELVRSVPPLAKEGGVALGLTPSETRPLRDAPVHPDRGHRRRHPRLGPGPRRDHRRAGHQRQPLNTYPHSIFDPFSTMAATIAALLDCALTDSTGMAVHALAEVGAGAARP